MAPGADTIIKLIVTVILITVLVFVAGVYNLVVGPVWDNVVDPSLMTDLNWASPQDVVLLLGGLALIAMLIIVFIWWIVSPVREDVRQEQTRGRF